MPIIRLKYMYVLTVNKNLNIKERYLCCWWSFEHFLKHRKFNKSLVICSKIYLRIQKFFFLCIICSLKFNFTIIILVKLLCFPFVVKEYLLYIYILIHCKHQRYMPTFHSKYKNKNLHCLQNEHFFFQIKFAI